MSHRAEIVILGAGILGSALAWRLVSRGLCAGAQVLVVDPNPPAAQATSRAAALLSLARPASKAHWIALVQQTLRAVDELAGVGYPVPVHRCGTLHLADQPQAQATLDELEAVARQHGLPCRRCAPCEQAAALPWLDMASFTGALWFAQEGYADPYLLATAYAAAAKSQGVRFRHGVSRRLMTQAGSVAVVLPDDVLHPKSIWVAAGAWSQRLLQPLGLVAAQAAVRSQYWITASTSLAPPDMPMVVVPELRLYARPEVGAILFGLREPAGVAVASGQLPDDLAGFLFDPADPDGHATLAHFVEPLQRHAPGLLQVGLRHYISGPSGYTPDGDFLVGGFAAWPQVKLLSGCNGAGIAVSAGLADLAADFEAGLAKPDAARYAPERFGPVDPETPQWLARCIAARAGKLSG